MRNSTNSWSFEHLEDLLVLVDDVPNRETCDLLVAQYSKQKYFRLEIFPSDEFFQGQVQYDLRQRVMRLAGHQQMDSVLQGLHDVRSVVRPMLRLHGGVDQLLMAVLQKAQDERGYEVEGVVSIRALPVHGDVHAAKFVDLVHELFDILYSDLRVVGFNHGDEH